MLFKFSVLCGVILVLSACGLNSETQQSLKALTKQVDELQQEQRLLLKEVISLQKKVDGLAVNAQRAKGQQKNALKPIKLPINERLLGSQKAEYAMIEFMDYQCPYCVRYAKQVLPVIKERYIETGMLKYGIVDFPLDFHSKAKGAAVAANCAGKQGQYWPMHDQLVVNSKQLSNELYQSLASDLQLNIKEYLSCLSEPAMLTQVDADLAYGKQVGTRGTPNFYIGKIEGNSITNVVHISGSRSIEVFDRAIQQVISSNSTDG